MEKRNQGLLLHCGEYLPRGFVTQVVKAIVKTTEANTPGLVFNCAMKMTTATPWLTRHVFLGRAFSEEVVVAGSCRRTEADVEDATSMDSSGMLHTCALLTQINTTG